MFGIKVSEMMNRLELILATCEYDLSYQPYKSKGLYINGTELIVYEQNGELTEQRMMYFLNSVVTGAAHINNNDESFMDSFFEHTISGADHVKFDFYLLPYGQEQKVIPLVKENSIDDLEKYTFCVTDDGVVHNLEISARMIQEHKEKAHIEFLQRIAAYEPNPNSFLDGFEISSFANEHFGKLKSVPEIKKKFKELAKIHHPDKNGNELMFKAICRTKEFLLEQCTYVETKTLC